MLRCQAKQINQTCHNSSSCTLETMVVVLHPLVVVTSHGTEGEGEEEILLLSDLFTHKQQFKIHAHYCTHAQNKSHYFYLADAFIQSNFQ